MIEGAGATAAKGNALFGKIKKLSNRGWSINDRYFKINDLSLCYFSKDSKDDIAKAHSGKAKPKQSIPLKYIIEMDYLNNDATKTPNDCEEIKKFKDLYH